jgi:hypothetical protein
MRTKILQTLTCAVLSSVVCVSAGTSPRSSSTDESNGTFVSDASRDKVHSAVLRALEQQGYTVVFDNGPTGELATIRKLVARGPVDDPTRPADATSIFRAYQIRIHGLPDGRIEVVATPRLFQGERPLSPDAAAPDDGSEGQRGRWKELFRQVQAGL